MEVTLITNFSWGQMEVKIGGQIYHFKDCKIWPGGARTWNWVETGTEHIPGIQPADIMAVLENDVNTMVLACGVFGRLGVCAETETLLRERGIPYHIEKTKQAVALFNDLARQGKRVGGLFHSTC